MITFTELKEIAKELKIHDRELSFETLKNEVDTYIRTKIKKGYTSADNMSKVLKEYLFQYFQCVFQDRYGNLYDDKGNKIGKRKGYEDKIKSHGGK